MTMRVFTPDGHSGDDTSQVQKTIDAAIEARGRAYFPWKGRPYELEDTVRIEPAEGLDQTMVVIEGDPVWNLFEYHGPPGRSVFRSLGLKRSTLRNLGLRCFASSCVGFDLAGDSRTLSSSNNRLDSLRVQFEARTQNGTGFSVGRGGDDHSMNVFSLCEAYSAFPGRAQQASYLDQVDEAGHTGFSLVGPNTLGQSLRDCTAVGMKVGFKTSAHAGHRAGGARTLFDNCGGTACCLGYWIPAGFGAQIRGGRWELCGSLLLHGNPKGAAGTPATLLLSAVTFDSFFPVSGAKCGLFEEGEVIGLRTGAEVVIQACETLTGGLGEPLDSRAVRLVSAGDVEPVLHWQGNLRIPLPERAESGQWRLVVDGQARLIRPKTG